MIIGIDTSKLLTPAKTGVEVSTVELIKALLKLDQVNNYWLYSPSPLSGVELNERVRNIVVPGKRLWTLRSLSGELKRSRPDIFWSPSNFLPFNLPAKSVATIHDLAFYLYPQSYSIKSRLLSFYALRRAIRAGALLIAVSQQTKKDLKRYFDVPGENIEVIYHALRTDFDRPDIDLVALYPQLAKYFIYVGRLELRKNLLNVIRAFMEFQKQAGEPVQLLLAGSAGYGYGRIARLVKRLGLQDSVILKDYVPAEHLPTLYKKSLGLVFASQYEGFGLNILEGFAAGVPVLTSDLGAMAEVAGGAALLVDPDDIDAISGGMLRLYRDENLHRALIDKGKVRLSEFSWERSAQKLIELWKKL
jgi:glycosyltransferase involved in cell wall biosynthesis